MLNRFIKQVMLLGILVIGLFSCTEEGGIDRKILVPTNFVQAEVEKLFPISANMLIGTGSITNPKVHLKEDKLVIGMGYRVTMLGGAQEGSFTLSSGIRYDATSQSIYLINFTIDDIKNNNGVRIDDSRIAGIIKELLTNYIASKPVYTFDGTENKYIKALVKNVIIENSKLYVRT